MKKQQLENQNLINLNSNNFISFMENPSSVSRILQEYTQITEKFNTEDLENQKINEASGRVKPLDFLCGFGRVTTSSDITKFLCMVYPTRDRLYEFWNMILETNSHVIVTLTANRENDNQYRRSDAEVACKEIRITTVGIVIMDCCTKTMLQLKQDGKVKEVVLLHYTKWPADNMSHCPSQLIRFISIVNAVSVEGKTDRDVPSRPIVVQCRDGAKSSVFCLLDICISEFKKNKVVSVTKALLKMRQIYGNTINQPENYVFCYNALYHFVVTCRK